METLAVEILSIVNMTNFYSLKDFLTKMFGNCYFCKTNKYSKYNYNFFGCYNFFY